MLGVRVDRCIPSPLPRLRVLHYATRIYSGVVVAGHMQSFLSWVCFSTQLYSRIQHDGQILFIVKRDYRWEMVL